MGINTRAREVKKIALQAEISKYYSNKLLKDTLEELDKSYKSL